MKKITLVLISFFAFNQVNAQYSKENQKQYVQDLSTDQMQGRKFASAENKVAAEYIAHKFKMNNLKPCVGDSFLIEFEHKGQTGQNVCGIKEGKSKDIYAFGAHYDHVGVDDKGDDKIYNGADDNASGTSAVMALSDYFKDLNPDQTVMFMAFDAEEIGLVGSKKLVENTDFKTYLPDMKLMLNLEMIGTVSAFGEGKVYMTGSDRSDLMKLMNQNTSGKFHVESDPYLKQKLFFRSDNVNFVNNGVVSHALSSVNMENQTHYHKKNDDMTVINVDNLSEITQGIGKSVYQMMQKKEIPQYSK